MHSIKLLCTTASQPCNSLFLVGSDAGPPRCSRLAADLRLALWPARCARSCTFVRTGDYEYIMPVRAGTIGTVTEVYTECAQAVPHTSIEVYAPAGLTLGVGSQVLAYCCSRGLLLASVVGQAHCCSVVIVQHFNTVGQSTLKSSNWVSGTEWKHARGLMGAR